MSFTQKLIAVFVVVTATAAPTAFGNIRFNHISTDDGLSQGFVQALIQDQQGFIWIGTQMGLNRYDGYEFLTYFHRPGDPDSLSNDWIWALEEDDQGRIWLGTKQGLNSLDPVTGAVTRYLHDPENDASIGGDVVRALAIDQQGRIWVGTEDGGVSRLDPHSGVIKRFQHDTENPGSISSDRVKALHIDASGYVWVGTDGGGLNRIDPVREVVSRVQVDGEAGTRVRALATDADGMLWVGTNEEGLFLFDPKKGDIRHFVHDPDDAGSLSSNSIRVLYLDDSDQLWVGTDSHGLNRYDPATSSFSRIVHNSADPRSISDDHIAALFQDNGGVIWVGTYLGVDTWNPLMGGFRTYARNQGDAGELSTNLVAAFAEAADGRLLVATVGGGLNAVDLESGYAERLDVVGGEELLSDSRLFALEVSAAGDIWAGTRAGGLNHFDPISGRWQVFQHDPEDPASLSGDAITSLLLEDDRILWVGTYGRGLNRMDLTSGAVTRFQHDPTVPHSLCSDRVLGILQDQAGRLWISTEDGGFCEFDRASGRFTTIRHDHADEHSLSSNAAWTMVEDPSGNLWIGTADQGLNLWRAADRRAGRVHFTRIGVAQGLNRAVVYSMLSDAMGRIWVAGNRGLTRINGESLTMRHYTVVDGLQSNEFTFAAAYRASNGQLFFGGTSGFSAFFPEQIGISLYPPTVALTRFQRNYDTLPMAALQNEEGQVVLDHKAQRVTFEYSALDFTNPKNNQYEHWLEGFDSGWVADGVRNRVTYTNLPAGEYELKVRAANNDGVWSSEELRIPIIVKPAPWATWWAQGLYMLTVALLILFAYRIYSVRLARAAELNRVQASLISEITERQVREVELARTRRRAQRYLDVVEVIILALDAQGNVTLVNQKGTRVFGYSESEIVGRNFYDWFVPDEYRQEVRERFENLEQYAYSESPIKPKEGDERMIAWHSIAAPAMDDDDRAPGGVLISGTDVTQMRNLERQLRDAQKMEALGTLARGVAHDFNNILSSILGYAELSLADVRDPSRVTGYLEKLESSVNRARDLVARILTFGRGSGQVLEPVYVQSAVREALELLQPVLASNISLQESLSAETGAVLADPTQLVQVVLNLCTNAAQAMSLKGGRLSVEVAPHEIGIEEARSMVVLVPGSYVRLTVSDTGPGMDDYTLDRIFDPFFTTRTRDEGTGLGLAVVHGIVTQLHGSVQVFSAPDEGTRFDVYLPRCTDLPADSPQDPARDRAALRGQETILFVDDEPSVRAIGEESLGLLGYRVLTAADGEQALAKLREHTDEIDVVVTDQTMPNLLGHQLAEAIKLERADLPVVLMSGAGRPVTDAVDCFVDKPFTLPALAQAVRSVLPETSS
jgi:PAS domain S-box-containing protein